MPVILCGTDALARIGSATDSAVLDRLLGPFSVMDRARQFSVESGDRAGYDGAKKKDGSKETVRKAC